MTGSILHTQDRHVISLCTDANQRLRVSSAIDVFGCKQTFDEQPLFFSTSGHGVGGGTIVYTNATQTSRLSVTTTGDHVIRQTKRYMNYQAGKSQQASGGYTFVGGLQAGVTKRVGYFDAQNGIFIEAAGTDLFVVYRVGGVDIERIARANWIDRLDGNGPSGITLALDGRQLMCVSFAGSGATDGKMGLLINGRWVPLAAFGNGNDTHAGLQTPNLPFRWEVLSTGGAGAMDAMGCVISSEGGVELIGSNRVAFNDTGHAIGAGAFEQLVAIRNRDGQFLRAPIIPRGIDVMSTTTSNGQWFLIMNPTVSGTPTWTPLANSFAEFDVARTTVTAGTGTILYSGYFTTSNSISSFSLREALQLGADIAGTTRDELVLAVKNRNAQSNTFFGTISWLEPN